MTDDEVLQVLTLRLAQMGPQEDPWVFVGFVQGVLTMRDNAKCKAAHEAKPD